LRKGDVLTAIDRHPASDYDLDKIDQLFQQTGRTLHLTIQRGDRTLEVDLELKERI